MASAQGISVPGLPRDLTAAWGMTYAGGGAPPYDPPASVTNYNASYLSVFAASVAAAGSPTVLWEGDSSVANYGGTAPTNNIAYLTSALMATAGIPASNDGQMGGADHDTRVSTNFSLAYGLWYSNTTSQTFDFTPQYQFDRVEMIFRNSWNTGTSGMLSVGADGGAPVGNVDLTGTNILVKKSFSFPGLCTTLNLVKLASGDCVMVDLRCYNSALDRVVSVNNGVDGATSTVILTGYEDPIRICDRALLFTPTLNILESGILNDYSGNIALATSLSNVQALIDKHKATGDVILLLPNDTQVGGGQYGYTTANGSGSTLADYANGIKALGVTNNCVCVSWKDILGTYPVAQAAGDMADSVHPNAQGNAKLAAVLAPLLLSVT